MNYCSECGFKVKGEYKFCPNCGSKTYSGNTSFAKTETVDLVVCKNCGEENSKENSECLSCGVPLSGAKIRRPSSPKQKLTKNVRKKSVTENFSSNKNVIREEKVLDNKKILIITSAIVAVFIFALVASGAFDSGVQNNVSQMSNPTSNSGVNLANMEEITKLENKVSANPDDMESTLHLAHLQQDEGLSENAITNYKNYLSKFPENADARVDMAICFYNLGDYSSAINEMETAIKYQPTHQIAHLNLGIVNLAATNIDASKAWFKKTVELDPNSEAGKRAQELLNSH